MNLDTMETRRHFWKMNYFESFSFFFLFVHQWNLKFWIKLHWVSLKQQQWGAGGVFVHMFLLYSELCWRRSGPSKTGDKAKLNLRGEEVRITEHVALEENQQVVHQKCSQCLPGQRPAGFALLKDQCFHLCCSASQQSPVSIIHRSNGTEELHF